MSSTFKYAPLEPRLNQIRLIELHSGVPEDAIHCTIRVQSLDDNPQYEALSYAWGELFSDEAIILDNQHFAVSTTLLFALRNIQCQDRTRTLWVDALSIDQKNGSEKEWQVSNMGEIFKKCTGALLWIGKDSERSDACCPFRNQSHCDHCIGTVGSDVVWSSNDRPSSVKHKQSRKDTSRRLSLSSGSYGQAKCKHLKCRWHGKRPKISKAVHLMKSLEQDKHLHEIPALRHTGLPREKLEYEIMEPLMALGALMSRRWWTRMWTVQEAALPPTSTLCWGRSTYSLEKMATSAERLFFHSQNCCSAFFASLIQRLDKLSCDEATMNALFNFQKHVHALELTRRWIRNPGTNINLMDCLYNFHDRISKYPRDKIFACLGLSPSKFGIKANYGITDQQLYRDISLHLLRSCSDRSLSVLWRESEPTNSLPSWVKEFNRETTALNRRARSKHYNACNGGKIQPPDYIDGVLSFLGTKVDILKDVTQNAHSASTYSGCQFSTFREWARFLTLNDRQSPYSPGVTWIDAFARTLSGDVHGLCQEGCGLDEQKLTGFVRSLMKKRPRNGLVETSLAQELNTSAAGRKMFKTERGRIGLGPKWMQPGDEVWVLSGGTVPFIFRPLSFRNIEGRGVEQPNSQKHHVVVGDCYIQGIMFGEAVPATTLHEYVFLE